MFKTFVITTSVLVSLPFVCAFVETNSDEYRRDEYAEVRSNFAQQVTAKTVNENSVKTN
jgi:hypothetical protein